MDEKYIILFSNCNVLEGIILYAGDAYQAAGKATEISYLHGEDIIEVLKVEDDEVNDAEDSVDDAEVSVDDNSVIFMMFDEDIIIKNYNANINIKELSLKILKEKAIHFIAGLNGKLPSVKINTRVEAWSENIAFHYFEVEKRK